tara:strand:- start:106 stop:303 length:198 start_codon:yes stop_codon:yes gene_type:complete
VAHLQLQQDFTGKYPPNANNPLFAIQKGDLIEARFIDLKSDLGDLSINLNLSKHLATTEKANRRD